MPRLRRLLNTPSAVTLLLTLASLCAIPGASAKQSAAHRTTARKNNKAAAMPLIDADGYHRVLDKYRGKPVMVNFWATWCETCRYEFPLVVQLAHQYEPRGL